MSHVLTGFVQRVTEKKLNVLSARVRQGGRLAAQWDAGEDIRRVQHSISKSFTCMAAGLAIEEGKLTLETTLGDVFPQHVREGIANDPALEPGRIRLYDLLRMASGHDAPPLWADERKSLQEKDWAKYYMSLQLDRLPASGSPTAAETPS